MRKLLLLLPLGLAEVLWHRARVRGQFQTQSEYQSLAVNARNLPEEKCAQCQMTTTILCSHWIAGATFGMPSLVEILERTQKQMLDGLR